MRATKRVDGQSFVFGLTDPHKNPVTIAIGDLKNNDVH
jgi:hypothetical protein